jgi:hypothetical protein
MVVFKSLTWLALTLAMMAASAHADSLKPTDELFQQIQQADQSLFDAYNRCDLAVLGDAVETDLEFYHDKGGLAVGRDAFLTSTKTYVCGKVRRQLMPETLEVYPVKDFGAIEIGKHIFCDPARFSQCVYETSGEGKFFMLWKRGSDGKYRLSRVISYDHLSDWERAPAVVKKIK